MVLFYTNSSALVTLLKIKTENSAIIIISSQPPSQNNIFIYKSSLIYIHIYISYSINQMLYEMHSFSKNFIFYCISLGFLSFISMTFTFLVIKFYFYLFYYLSGLLTFIECSLLKNYTSVIIMQNESEMKHHQILFKTWQDFYMNHILKLMDPWLNKQMLYATVLRKKNLISNSFHWCIDFLILVF